MSWALKVKYNFDRQAQEKGQKRPKEWVLIDCGVFKDTLISLMPLFTQILPDIMHGIFRYLQSKIV